MAIKKSPGKLQIELLALADNAFLSKDNKLNIIGIFDIFGIAEIPSRWPRMSLVLVFKGKSGGLHSVKVKIKNPEKSLLEREFSVKLGENGKSNFITTLNNFPLEAFGEYLITVTLGDKQIGKYKFNVIKRKPASPKKPGGLVN